MLAESALRVDDAAQHAATAIRRQVATSAARLETLTGKLGALGPPAVLARGYSICRRADDRVVVTRATQVRPGEDVEITVSEGRLTAETKSVGA